MTKRTVAGYITVSFDDQDFRRPLGKGALGMVELMKARIPATDRSYDPETKTWHIKETKLYQEIVGQCYRDAFVDPSQEGLEL